MNTQETKDLPSIDEILRNLKENPKYYDHGMNEQMWMQECNGEDEI